MLDTRTYSSDRFFLCDDRDRAGHSAVHNMIHSILIAHISKEPLIGFQIKLPLEIRAQQRNESDCGGSRSL